MEDELAPSGIATLSPPNGEVPLQADYFGFSATRRLTLPDKVSFIDLKVLNEGERRKYLNETNREVRFSKGSGDALMKMRPGDEKNILLKIAIVGWNLTRGGLPMGFNPQGLDLFLNSADPLLVDLIEKEIRSMNPWLLAEMTVADIDREIEQLQEMRKVKVEEEAGKAIS